MSDTPETDAKASFRVGFHSFVTVPVEFARKLEQERDEARKALVRSNHFLQQAEENLDLVYKERDEARARVEIITPSKNNPVAEYFSSSNTPETDAAVKDSNGQWSFVLKETCQRLERERNEAILVMRETRRRLDDAWLEIERLKNP